MSARNLELERDAQALPGLVLDGIATLDDAIQSIRLGEFTARWFMDELLVRAHIRASLKAGGRGESAFAQPKAQAAIGLLESLMKVDICREDIINCVWKTIGCRDQEWLSILIGHLGCESLLTLLITKPIGVAFHTHLLEPAQVLLDKVKAIPDTDLVEFAQTHNCVYELYQVTRREALLETADSRTLDAVFSGDLGL